MADDNLFSDFIDREIQTLEIFLVAKATRTASTLEEYIAVRLLQGADSTDVEKELTDDLDNGGRIFGEFRNAVKATSNGVINRTRDTAIFADVGLEGQFRWVAVLVNTCPDCLERHGMSRTYIEWELYGLPRTGTTVCKENCRCMLLPASTAIIEPIQRTKR